MNFEQFAGSLHRQEYLDNIAEELHSKATEVAASIMEQFSQSTDDRGRPVEFIIPPVKTAKGHLISLGQEPRTYGPVVWAYDLLAIGPDGISRAYAQLLPGCRFITYYTSDERMARQGLAEDREVLQLLEFIRDNSFNDETE